MGYSIYGAGATSDNRIIVKVACGEPAIIPYIVKYENNDPCNPITEFYNYTREVGAITCNCYPKPLGACDDWISTNTKEGSFTGEHNLEVYYKIISELDCHDYPPCESDCTVGNYWIEKGEGDEITIKYELFNFEDCDTVTKTIESVVTACTGEGEIISIVTPCKDYKFDIEYECNSGCSSSSGTVINVRGILFNPVSVAYSGGNIDITVSYERIETDEECNERRSRGSFVLSGEVSSCKEYSADCCSNHSVEYKISKSEILSAIGVTNAIVTYKGKQINDHIAASIIQNKSTEPECNTDCEYKTTYCVLEYPINTDDTAHTIDVAYETYWGSKIWSERGPIPPYGGRVKVSFDYVATAIPTSANCSPYTFNGSDSVIIEVPACENGSSDIYKLPGEILYKERTPAESGCSSAFTETGHISAETITDAVTGEKTIMNLIMYEVEQTCTGMCEPITYKKYDPANKLPGTFSACTTFIEAKAPYSSITIDKNCEMTVVPSAETVSVQVEPNETDERRQVQTEYFTFWQEAGPCHSEHTCDCDSALEIIGGDYRGRSIECVNGCTIEACEEENTMQLRIVSGGSNDEKSVIYIDGSGFYGPIVRFDTSCITDIDIEWNGDKQDWLDFSVDDNYIIAQIDPLYSDSSDGRTATFNIVYSMESGDEYAIQGESDVECSGEFKYTVEGCVKEVRIEQKSNDVPPESI